VAPVRDANAAEEKQIEAVTSQTPSPGVKVVAVPTQKASTVVAKPAGKPVLVTPVSKPSAAVAKPAVKPAVITVGPAIKAGAGSVKVAAAPQKINVSSPKMASVSVVQSNAAVKAGPAKTVIAAKPIIATKPALPATAMVAVKSSIATPKAGDPFKKSKTAAIPTAPAVAKGPDKTHVGNVVAVNESKPAEQKKSELKKLSAADRRDPFVSPVVHMGAMGSGCSSGKRCLAIDQIALRGVVRSENGMIAVVVNSMDKAYFLRENDPVFNGYVTKITPDSIIFKETFRDKLGKEMTRDVTKSIIRPVA
jgi:Tfp pilus assembly protein PilP